MAGVRAAQLSKSPLTPRFMKTNYIFLGLLVISTAVFARFPSGSAPWDKAKPPSLPLPAAYQLAIAALGQATNQFHCVDARLSTELSLPGWHFTFYSTNISVTPRCFCVEFDSNAIEDDSYVPQ